MSYKTLRVYEVPKLFHTFNTPKLIREALKAVEEADGIDAFNIEFTLTFTYPDLTYVRAKQAGWRHAHQRLVDKIRNTFTQVERFFETLQAENPALPPEEFNPTLWTSSARKTGQQYEKKLRLNLPTVSTQILQFARILLTYTLTQKHLQYSDTIKLTITAHCNQNGQYKKTKIIEKHAQKIPYPTKLKPENKNQILKYYEKVAEIIAEQCKDHHVYADQLRNGQNQGRRYTKINGQKQPITINTPQDVINYVKNQNLAAFYPSVETLHSHIDTAVIDLDPQPGAKLTLGQKLLWRILFLTAKAYEENAKKHGINTNIAWKYSGGKGIHGHLHIQKNAINPQTVKPYLEALKAVDPNFTQKKTTQTLLDPFTTTRLTLQALALDTMHEATNWVQETWMKKLNIEHKPHIFTLSLENPNSWFKIYLDFSTNKPKGVYRSNLSLHPTGKASINLCNQTGVLDPKYADWKTVQQHAEPEHIIKNIQTNKSVYRQHPGTITGNMLQTLLQSIAPTISILFRFGPDDASQLTPEEYHHWKNKYTKIIRKQQKTNQENEPQENNLTDAFNPLLIKIFELKMIEEEILELEDHYQNNHQQEETTLKLRRLNNKKIRKLHQLKETIHTLVRNTNLPNKHKADLLNSLHEWAETALETKQNETKLINSLHQLLKNYSTETTNHPTLLKKGGGLTVGSLKVKGIPTM